MMMVVTVMAVALHLIKRLRDNQASCQIFFLRTGHSRAENGAVRAGMRFTALAVVVLGVCLAGMAQYQDRDTRGVPKTSATAPPPEARIDINHASIDELLKAPGMTPSWAGRIVRFRPYRTKQDLLEHGVVTSQVYERIKDYVIAHREAQ
jgi:DNA uptake protein ComE-like DNA-binding protein